MDAQSRVREVAPLVALIQSLACLELEGEPSSLVPSAEVLAENRFLAARDGMDALLIDPAARRLIPVREMLDALLAELPPARRRARVRRGAGSGAALAAANGADVQRAFVAHGQGLDHLVATLADQFLAPRSRTVHRGPGTRTTR